MYRLLLIVLCIVFSLCVSLEAQTLDYNKDYFFKAPIIKDKSISYDSKIKKTRVRLYSVDENTFTINPLSEYKKWFKSLEEHETEGWIGKTNKDNTVTISGVWVAGEGFFVVNAEGSFVDNNVLKGTLKRQLGITAEKLTPFVYESEWCLEPVDTDEILKISTRVAYQGPPSKTIRATTSTPEERAKRPIDSDSGIKRFANSKNRKKFKKIIPKERSCYYENLLKEFAWDEIKYAPGILLLIDHLATLDEVDQKRIAKAYIDDKSMDFFERISYEEIQKTPPLFMILKCSDKMKKKDIDGLNNESERFGSMFAGYNELPKEDLAEMSLSEFVITMSEQLTENSRKKYYNQSKKLKDYVLGSKDETLKGLYPFQVK